MVNNVIDYLNNSSEKFPDKIALVEGDKNMTFWQLKTIVNAIASYIINLGNLRKEPIAVMMEKNIMCIPCFLGIVASGNIYVPIDTHAPAKRIEKILHVLKSKIIFTDFEQKKSNIQLFSKEGQVIYVEEAIQHVILWEKISEIQRNIIDTDPLYVMFTSGSTGIPKGVVINHRAVIDFVEESTDMLNFNENDILLNQVPFYFDVSIADIYCTLKNACTLHLVDSVMFKFPLKLLEYMQEKEISSILWVPSALRIVADMKALKNVSLPNLKRVMFCGEVMPNKQLNQWREYVPNAIYVNYYGPTETTCASTYYIVNRKFKDNESLPIGEACINTKVLIINDENELVTEENKIGELYIGGSGLALGYFNDLKKTEQMFVQNPLHKQYTEIIYRTGDLVYYNMYGEIEYVGRKDTQIKHMGYRIELGEIEAVVSSLQNVNACCCLYNSKEKKIVLFLSGNIDIDQTRKQLEQELPKYMNPSKYIKLEEMPINANGKIDRAKLKNIIGDNKSE